MEPSAATGAGCWIFWIVNGAVETFAALSHRGMQGRGWTILMGLLSVLAGIMEVVLAFRLRQAGQAATRVATAT